MEFITIDGWKPTNYIRWCRHKKLTSKSEFFQGYWLEQLWINEIDFIPKTEWRRVSVEIVENDYKIIDMVKDSISLL